MSDNMMPNSITRRALLAGTAAIAVLLSLRITPAMADPAQANAFMQGFARDLIAIVNGPLPAAQKKAALGPVVDRDVDVPTIARFCLGRFWNKATPEQQTVYIKLFHQVMLDDISGHLGDYVGVSYVLTNTRTQGDDYAVGTTLTRPNASPADVQWVISTHSGAPKVIDVVAEGSSLRLARRNDYASYLSHHGNDVGALIAALQQQMNANG